MKNTHLFTTYLRLSFLTLFYNGVQAKESYYYPGISAVVDFYTQLLSQLQATYHFSTTSKLFKVLSVSNFTESSTCLSTDTNYKSLSNFHYGNNSSLNRQ